MSMKVKIRSFFGSSRQYAVTGASSNSSKFGFKILLWYINHKLPVVPVNPKSSEILGQVVAPSVIPLIEAIKVKKDLGSHKLSRADGLSISFLTPPGITVATLREIASVDGYENVIKGLWFQPGSYDGAVIEEAKAIGLFDVVVYEDECILVRGEEGLYSANL